ncbi:hypothetical protein TREES_T100010643 [Tupaia chinensis]|uniref:Uncharacterized protein n=1 Tax=Tupaia chinensis TaxID=246437 RepID=L9L5D5_TUPCH|nr:hypothetical protein TREES_T100010643 [Tupaia chinensis]
MPRIIRMIAFPMLTNLYKQTVKKPSPKPRHSLSHAALLLPTQLLIEASRVPKGHPGPYASAALPRGASRRLSKVCTHPGARANSAGSPRWAAAHLDPEQRDARGAAPARAAHPHPSSAVRLGLPLLLQGTTYRGGGLRAAPGFWAGPAHAVIPIGWLLRRLEP